MCRSTCSAVSLAAVAAQLQSPRKYVTGDDGAQVRVAGNWQGPGGESYASSRLGRHLQTPLSPPQEWATRTSLKELFSTPVTWVTSEPGDKQCKHGQKHNLLDRGNKMHKEKNHLQLHRQQRHGSMCTSINMHIHVYGLDEVGEQQTEADSLPLLHELFLIDRWSSLLARCWSSVTGSI